MRKKWRKVLVSVCVFIGLLYPGNMMYLLAGDGEIENESLVKESLFTVFEEIEIVDALKGDMSSAEYDELSSVEKTDAASDETIAEVVEDVTTEEENIDITKQRQIRVALIDTGVDTTSEVLQGHIADGYDISNMSDVNGHGTLMAEVIASNTNENVKILPYRVFDENGKATVGATYYALLKAINDEVDVISLSVSGYGTSNMLTSAIGKARENGIYVVVAAGNNGDNANNYMPGNVSESITVSGVSVDETGKKTLAVYSNYGSVVDYSALGTIVKDKGTEDISDDEVFEGTSISAANVSSYIATMLQYIKDDCATENDEVLDALNSTIEDLGEVGRDDSFGEGYLFFDGVQKFFADQAQLESETEENDSKKEEIVGNEDIILTDKSGEEEEQYPDEEGDIDFDFEKEDAAQELETSASVTTVTSNTTLTYTSTHDLGQRYVVPAGVTLTINCGNANGRTTLYSSDDMANEDINQSQMFTVDGGKLVIRNAKINTSKGNVHNTVVEIFNAGGCRGQVVFENCSFSGWGNYITAETQTKVTVTDCTFNGEEHPDYRHAIIMRGASFLKATGCTFKTNRGICDANNATSPNGGFVSNAGDYNFKVNNCVFECSGTGILTGYNTYEQYKTESSWHIWGCDFKNCGTGIFLLSNNSKCKYQLTDNSFNNCSDGINNSAKNVYVKGSDSTRVFKNCTSAAIKNFGTMEVYSSGDGFLEIKNSVNVGIRNTGTLTVKNAKIAATDYGINNSGKCIIMEGSVSSTKKDGIHNTGSQCDISSATISNCADNGVYNSNKCSITSSSIKNNNKGVNNHGTIMVRDSIIHRNRTNGIYNSGTMTVGGGLADMRIYGNGGYGIVNRDTITATALSLGFSTWTSQSDFAISTNHGGIDNSGTFNATENIRIYQNGTAHGINNSGTFNNKLANYANGTAPSIVIYKGRTANITDDTGISIGYQNTSGGKYIDSSTTSANPLVIMGAMKEGVHNAGPNIEKGLSGGSFNAKKVTISGNFCLGLGNTSWTTTTANGISANGIWNGGTMSLPSVSISGIGTNADGLENTGTISVLSGTVIGGKTGIYNKGAITHKSGTIIGKTWGLYNNGTYTQSAGLIQGSSVNKSGSKGGVYQNGIYNVSGTAQVASGDVYLCLGKTINVNGVLTGTGQVASIDSEDKKVGTVLVMNTYQSGASSQETCEQYVNGKTIRFSLSKNLMKAKTTSADTSEVNATYNSANSEHNAVLRAGQGAQNNSSESENAEVMNKNFTNGTEGTLVLSCYLNVTYDLSKVEELTGLNAGTYDAFQKLTTDYNSNIWKEGFTACDTEFNTFSNNNDYEVILSPSNQLSGETYESSNQLSEIINELSDGANIADLLVSGKTYYTENNKSGNGSDSYTFLGWCLQEDGSGYIYNSPTSFPIGNNYTWYPIFDVNYSVEYNSNYATPNRSDLGGEIYFDTYDKGSSTERKTEMIDTENMSAIEEDSFFKVTSKDEDTHLYSLSEMIGNCGPDSDIPDYWNKEIKTEREDYYTGLYEDYVYWYQFIGWSLDKTSNLTDFSNSDLSKKVYSPSSSGSFIGAKEAYVKNGRIVNNVDRISRWEFKKNYSDLIKVKDADNQSLLYATMYAVWDEYPEIFAKDFTLMSNDPALTNMDTFKQAVIENYVFTKDYELTYKHDENLTVTVDNTNYDAMKSIGHGGNDIGTVSVTVKVVDEVGNESYDTCDVTIISGAGITSRTDEKSTPVYVRFVDEKNWMKNDFWKVIFEEGNVTIEELSGTDNEEMQLVTMSCLCDAYKQWLTQTGVSEEVTNLLKDYVSDETIKTLQNLDTSQGNLQRVLENNTNDGALEPYSKWYLNPQLVLDIHEAFERNSVTK